jgi:hypothetical protein
LKPRWQKRRASSTAGLFNARDFGIFSLLELVDPAIDDIDAHPDQQWRDEQSATNVKMGG